MSDSLWPHGLQNARPPCPSQTPGACLNSCPLSQWYHTTISSSVVPFFSCREPAWGIPSMTRSCSRGLDGQGESGLRFSPWYFLSMYPPKIRICLPYFIFLLFWHSLEKVNSGLQSPGKRMSQFKTPSDNSLTCLTGSPGSLTACELLAAPQPWEAQSLKHLKRYRAFLKS